MTNVAIWHMDVSAFDIKERFEELTGESTVYGYLGILSENELNEVLGNMEEVLHEKLSSKPARKKIFNILIEICQNLHNYSLDITLAEIQQNIFILLQKANKGYDILTGNYLKKSEIPGIKTRIDMVNAMSEEEVKQLYRGILDFGGVSGGGGAGLGIVDLARRSGEKLVYKFEDVDDGYSFFTLKVSVSGS